MESDAAFVVEPGNAAALSHMIKRALRNDHEEATNKAVRGRQLVERMHSIQNAAQLIRLAFASHGIENPAIRPRVGRN